MAVTLKGNNGTYEGESTDIKPLDVPVNTEFFELDTGKTYYYDGETWNEEPPCEGSGFTPTESQLTAMNSGITAEDVTQIGTNETNISLIKHADNTSIYIQETQPESGSKGDYWISTTGNKIYHYSNNLFDGVLLAGVWDTADSRTSTDSNAYKSFKLNLPAGTYTISFAVAVNIVRLIIDGALMENIENDITSYTVTTTTDNEVGFSFRITGTPHTPWDNSNIMLNSGSTALPYEPYDEYSGQWV
jgi:hypothetical protein